MLYPGVFPNLAALKADRADLLAILLTGIPSGHHPRLPELHRDRTQADMLRLNAAVPPAATPNINGVIGGDLAGFPNGRRVFDNVVTIELRAIAGALYPLIDQDVHPGRGRGPDIRRHLRRAHPAAAASAISTSSPTSTIRRVGTTPVPLDKSA